MKEWVVNIAFTIFFVSLITLLLPSGKLSKQIKSVLSLIVVIIVIQPLLSIKESEINFDTFIYGENYQVQEDYLDYFTAEKIKNFKDKCSSMLKENGIEGAKCEFEYNYVENYVLEIKQIVVDIKKAVIKLDKQHIDIIEQIKTLVANSFNVEKNCVVVYE